MIYYLRKICLSVVLLGLGLMNASVFGAEIDELTAQINSIGLKGAGHAKARSAMAELAKTDVTDITQILSSFDSSNKLAVNWLRAAVDGIIEQATDNGEAVPIDSLLKFIEDRNNDANARRVAYEWIVELAPGNRDAILLASLQDPSLEIRRDAVAHSIAKAAALVDDDNESALAAYKMSLNSARDLDQIETITKAIEDLGGTVNLSKHFGFLMDWHLIGPFDNSGTKGFDVAYGPEVKIDLGNAIEGKMGNVKWFTHSTEDRYGMMDLNQIMPEKYKGAIAYAYTTFESVKAQDVEIRLGCVNGNKIWVNGKMITSNHVYHANTSIDQYIAKANLKAGSNEILVKVAQNEQEESWAQRWQFQLRVCDQFGTAILSSDRK